MQNAMSVFFNLKDEIFFMSEKTNTLDPIAKACFIGIKTCALMKSSLS